MSDAEDLTPTDGVQRRNTAEQDTAEDTDGADQENEETKKNHPTGKSKKQGRSDSPADHAHSQSP